ncbi:MAG: cation diffusion facilitator family transporter [Gammaproteobacteria bacterium]
MSSCCQDKNTEIDALQASQASVLKWVLAINAVMFVVEMTTGLLAHSTALLADSLDMLGDTLVYGFSLYVLRRGQKWLAISVILKGLIMLGFGLFVLGEAFYKILHPALPVAELIGAIGALALLANGLCLYLLWRHRRDDINMRSVWLCSRNDVLANLGVILAAAGVALLHSRWPDILIGLVIAGLFLHTAFSVLRDALDQYRQHT